MEDPSSFNVIMGKAATGAPIGGTRLKKKDGFTAMAKAVNQRCRPVPAWDHMTASNRWKAYRQKYIAAHNDSKRTGFGVSDEDRENGI
jgi:hypothetical protein